MTRKPLIGMCQGETLILLVEGRQIVVPVGCMIYAAELAEAINTVTAGEDDEAEARHDR